MTTAPPLYTAVVDAMGIEPDKIYARCSSLTTFNWNHPRPAPDRRVVPPKVGARPALPNKRKKTKR